MYQYDQETKQLMPPHFDLTKYESMKDASLKEWKINIAHRLHTLWLFVDEEFDRARSFALRALEYGDISSVSVDIKIESSVKSLDIDAFVEGYSNSSITDKEFIKYRSQTAYAKVNLCESDKVLIQDFTNWLDKERKHQKIKSQDTNKFFSPSRLRNLYQHRVLAYLDVKLWYLIISEPITHGQIGNIIYPDDRTGSVNERVRKTAKKAADEIQLHEINSFIFKYLSEG